jgi:cell division protein FtsB
VPARSPKWIVLAALGWAVAGCGSTNPPCPIDLTDVDAARRTAADAERQLEALNARRDRLEGEVAAADGERAELERRKAALEAEIEALGGGR